MKKVLIIMASIMLCGVVHANLVVNGSFENGTVGVYAGTDLPKSDSAIPGWRIYDTTFAAVTYELVSDALEATDGNNYVKITSTTTAQGPDSALDITQNGLGSVALSTGVNYTVSFDAKWVAGTDNNLALSIRTFDGNTIVEKLVTEGLSLTSDWATYSYEVTPTLLEDGGAEPNFYIGFRPKGANMLDETFYIDNVQVIPEPATMGLVGIAGIALFGMRRFLSK